jgi:hypothetical protein
MSLNSITVRVAHNYGQRVVYPVCRAAILFAEIAGTKTLTDNTLRQIKGLGLTIEVKQEEI